MIITYVDLLQLSMSLFFLYKDKYFRTSVVSRGEAHILEKDKWYIIKHKNIHFKGKATNK